MASIKIGLLVVVTVVVVAGGVLYLGSADDASPIFGLWESLPTQSKDLGNIGKGEYRYEFSRNAVNIMGMTTAVKGCRRPLTSNRTESVLKRLIQSVG